MQINIWLSFIGASIVFGLLPGPSVCFTVAYALKHGTRSTLSTILGQLAANCCQIVIVLFGMSSILERSVVFFQMLKICGAAYLIYLGIRQWTSGRPQVYMEKRTSAQASRKAFLDGFVVCGINPKAILYYAALLPQFIIQTGDERVQMIILAGTSIIVAAVVLIFYTLLADQTRRWFVMKRFWKTQNRLAGVLMVGAGVALSLAARE
jgi:homoserine/homoserine lactone efflux protein